MLIFCVLMVSITVLVLAALDDWARRTLLQMPHEFKESFRLVTDLGKSDWMLVGSGGLFLLMLSIKVQGLGVHARILQYKLAVYGALIFLSVASSGLIALIIKWSLGRARPALYEVVGPYKLELFAWKIMYTSFPSGHATSLGALSVALGLLFPRYRVPLFLVGGSLAMTRVIISAHYPSDVFAGFMLGALSSFVFWYWMVRLRFLKP